MLIQFLTDGNIKINNTRIKKDDMDKILSEIKKEMVKSRD